MAATWPTLYQCMHNKPIKSTEALWSQVLPKFTLEARATKAR
jgi:hypothetical protein